MSQSGSTWSPFQSPEVRDICAHLSPEEHARLLADARHRGKQLGQWIAAPSSVAAVSFMWSWSLGLVALVLLMGYISTFGLVRIRVMRNKTKNLLCDTAWARKHGYTPTSLRLMSPPWAQ